MLLYMDCTHMLKQQMRQGETGTTSKGISKGICVFKKPGKNAEHLSCTLLYKQLR